MPTDRRTVFLLTTLGMVLVSWFVAQRMILQPHQHAKLEAQRRLQEEETFLRTQQAIVNAWPQLQQYQLRLPQAVSPDWLMREVAKWAEQAQVSLGSLEPQPPHTLQGATRIGVAITFEGGYHEVGRFVSLIESATNYIHVDELDVRPAGARASSSGGGRPEERRVIAAVRMVLSSLYLPPLAQAQSDAHEPF